MSTTRQCSRLGLETADQTPRSAGYRLQAALASLRVPLVPPNDILEAEQSVCRPTSKRLWLFVP